MKSQKLLDQILPILHSVKDNPDQLQKILDFLLTEIYEEPEEKIIEVPEKYREVIQEIAESIDAGLVCFLNLETLELEEITKLEFEDPEEFEFTTDDTIESRGMKHEKWKKCITFEPVESREGFKIMEDFAGQMPDRNFQDKLFNALNRRKPFSNFRYVIDNSGYRQAWFDFKQHWLEEYVKDLLLLELESEEI